MRGPIALAFFLASTAAAADQAPVMVPPLRDAAAALQVSAVASAPPGAVAGPIPNAREAAPLSPAAIKALNESISWASAAGRAPSPMIVPGPDGRILFTFGESLHTVVCSPLRVCDIELEAGEVIQGTPQLGDSVRWTVTAATTGEGAERREHVIVKPTLAGLETNLIIPTDRRMYHLLLVSDESGFVSRVAFRYPDTEARRLAADLDARAAERRDLTAEFDPLQADNLNFDYRSRVVKGGRRVAFVPVRVFDDGRRTFIQMPPTLEVAETPALFVVGVDGKDQLVNFRVRNGFYIVDRIFEEAALVSAVGRHQERVSIERKRCRPTWMNDCRSSGHGE